MDIKCKHCGGIKGWRCGQYKIASRNGLRVYQKYYCKSCHRVSTYLLDTSDVIHCGNITVGDTSG